MTGVTGRITTAALAAIIAICCLGATPALAAGEAAAEGPALFGIPVDFILFGSTLLGVALFHHHTLRVALTGLAIILAYKFLVVGFKFGPGFSGFIAHLSHEWVILTNLFMLLMGFALLSKHFEESRVPAVLPKFLPDDWKGGLVLLFMIFVLSSFLDNVAAALIGGTIAATVFKHKVHIGYLAAIVANVIANVEYPELSEKFPFIGAAVWGALLLSAPLRKPEWSPMPETFKGSMFLLSLVLCASLMPVEKLPDASWHAALGLGFVSAVFDNIPLTALALKQGGYDWGFLAYAVGFGGSMIWFGSSAGVALSNIYPQAKDAGRWLFHGWHVTVAYVLGFFALLWILGWQPYPKHKATVVAQAVTAPAPAC